MQNVCQISVTILSWLLIVFPSVFFMVIVFPVWLYFLFLFCPSPTSWNLYHLICMSNINAMFMFFSFVKDVSFLYLPMSKRRTFIHCAGRRELFLLALICPWIECTVTFLSLLPIECTGIQCKFPFYFSFNHIFTIIEK